MVFSFYIAHIMKKLHLGPRPLGSDNLFIFSPVTIAGLYSTTSQSFMLLPTREIGEFVSFKFYKGNIRKNNFFGPPAAHECKLSNSFTPIFVARGYSTTSQSFMILPTRKVGELVMSQFFYLRKKHLGPRPPLSDNMK